MTCFAIKYPESPAGRREWNRRYSANAYYAGKHYAVRRKDANYWHELTVLSLLQSKVEQKLFEKRVDVVFYWNDRLDIDNHTAMGKMILDALKGRLIVDDSKKYVKSVKHDEHGEDCIRVCLSEAEE
jgi:hypothetical protein